MLEKSSGARDSYEQDLSLLFVDLSKAFDKIPQDLLWDKRNRIGFHPNFIKVLQTLYTNCHVTIMVNGCATEKVYLRSGVKQGCPLSPLLFALFMSDIGWFLEQSRAGVMVLGQIISALLFVDDLVRICRNRSLIELQLAHCHCYFRYNGLEINISKSNILSKEEILNPNITLSTSQVTLGEIELKDKYKYLGVNVSLGKPADIFRFQRKIIVSRLKSYAGMILSMARNSFDPIEIGEALWKSVALESVLFGIQIISVTKLIMSQLDSVQARFAADLIGVNRSTSHNTLAKKALQECMLAQRPFSGSWRSTYRQETQDILIECKVGNVLKDDKSQKIQCDKGSG